MTPPDRIYRGDDQVWRAEVAALRREFDMYRDMSKAALDHALASMNERLGLLNEFRVRDDEKSKTYVSQNDADAAHDRMREQTTRLEARISDLVPREVYDQRHAELIDRITRMERWQANMMGKYVGVSAVGAILTGVFVGFLVHLLG